MYFLRFSNQQNEITSFQNDLKSVSNTANDVADRFYGQQVAVNNNTKNINAIKEETKTIKKDLTVGNFDVYFV